MSPPLPINDSSVSGGGTVLPLIPSWLLRTRRIPRYIFLLICSPILIPFLCLTFPLICFAELCIRICRRRLQIDDPHHDRIRLRDLDEEAGGVGLLQRYLEDQLTLVKSVYECGDDDDEADCGIRDFDFFAPGQPALLVRSSN